MNEKILVIKPLDVHYDSLFIERSEFTDELYNDGYRELLQEMPTPPPLTAEDYITFMRYTPVIVYDEENDVYYNSHEKRKSNDAISMEIQTITEELVESDYIAAKAIEYNELGLEITNSMRERMLEREAKRIRIRELESLLTNE